LLEFESGSCRYFQQTHLYPFTRRKSDLAEQADNCDTAHQPEREARKAFKEVDAAKAMTEHDRAQNAFHENRERLKALRLAREIEQTKAK
jgi:hypothetical protein